MDLESSQLILWAYQLFHEVQEKILQYLELLTDRMFHLHYLQRHLDPPDSHYSRTDCSKQIDQTTLDLELR